MSHKVSDQIHPMCAIVGFMVTIVIGNDVLVNTKKLCQAKDITRRELLSLRTTEDAIPEVILLFHGATLMDKDPVGLGELDACDRKGIGENVIFHLFSCLLCLTMLNMSPRGRIVGMRLPFDVTLQRS